LGKRAKKEVKEIHKCKARFITQQFRVRQQEEETKTNDEKKFHFGQNIKKLLKREEKNSFLNFNDVERVRFQFFVSAE
jgi:hypothetical protein